MQTPQPVGITYYGGAPKAVGVTTIKSNSPDLWLSEQAMINSMPTPTYFSQEDDLEQLLISQSSNNFDLTFEIGEPVKKY